MQIGEAQDSVGKERSRGRLEEDVSNEHNFFFKKLLLQLFLFFFFFSLSACATSHSHQTQTQKEKNNQNIPSHWRPVSLSPIQSNHSTITIKD